jgi:hypothetical protein
VNILHLPVDLGGHPAGLAKAQRALGHAAVMGNLAWSPFAFDGDRNYGLPPGHPLRLVRREAGRLALLALSVAWADVIHGHFGQTLASLRPFPLAAEGRTGLGERSIVGLAEMLWLRDVRLWRRLGKTVAMTFYGDDLRLVGNATARNPWSHLGLPTIAGPLAARDPLKLRLVETLARLGVKLFAVNPDLMEMLPPDAQFLPYCHLDPARIAFRQQPGDGPVRFLHMPSDRLVKGTAHFIAAVEQLNRSGFKCTLTLVEASDNATALAALAEHDVLLDQLYVGWYGAVAVEAMAAGLPVVAHILPEDRHHLPPAMDRDLPVLAADPSSIATVLEQIVRMPTSARQTLAVAGRHFVEHWHDPATVARAVMEGYRLPPGSTGY